MAVDIKETGSSSERQARVTGHHGAAAAAAAAGRVHGTSSAHKTNFVVDDVNHSTKSTGLDDRKTTISAGADKPHHTAAAAAAGGGERKSKKIGTPNSQFTPPAVTPRDRRVDCRAV